jgi:hypothetical protein
MKLECAWPSAEETVYTLILDVDQITAFAAGAVPRSVQAMAEDLLFFRERDEAQAKLSEQQEKRAKRKAG